MDTTDKTKSAISTSALSTPQIPFIPAPVADVSNIYNQAIQTGAGITQQAVDVATAEQAAQQARDKQMSESNTIASLTMQKGQQGQDLASAYQSGGVNDLYKQLSGYNVEAQGLQRQSLANPLQQQNQAIGTGRVQGQVDQITAQNQRDIALKQLTLAQSAAIAQGNYDVAKNLADQQVNAKYAQIDAEIAARKINEEALYKNVTDPAIKKALEARMALTKKEEQMQVEKKEVEKSISDIGMTLRKYGVSDSVVKDVLSSTNIDDAIIKAGNNLRDPKAVLELQALKTDIALKQAQIAKTNREATLSQEPTATEKKEAIKNIASAKASIQAANDKITAVDAALKYTGGIATRVGTNLFTRGDNAKGFIPMVGPALAARGALAEATGEGQQLSGAVHQLTSGLTLQALIEAKANGATFGSLTDGERLMLASAATKLNDWEVKEKQGDQMVGTGYWNIDEKSFKQELKTIQDLSRRALLKSQGTLITPDEQKILDASFGAPVVSANQYFQ